MMGCIWVTHPDGARELLCGHQETLWPYPGEADLPPTILRRIRHRLRTIIDGDWGIWAEILAFIVVVTLALLGKY